MAHERPSNITPLGVGPTIHTRSAFSTMGTPDDLPAREQLELFSQPGQGPSQPEQDMKKRSATKEKQTKPRKKADGGDGGGGGVPAGGGGAGGLPGTHDASLEAEARRRYLNYALSVITSRAL